jgi:hypothetical protein
MYLTKLKAAMTEGLKKTFDTTPTQDFQGENAPFVSIEYPMDRQQYPSVWVTYDDRDSLTIAGIDHREFVVDDLGGMHDVTRWKFAGTVTLTAVALSSLERDNLYDELVRIYAFSRIEQDATPFRNTIETNDFIAVVPNWDELRPGGDGAAPGTPWGTEDEVIYEKSASFDVEGEFVSDPATAVLVPLSAIKTSGFPTNDDGDQVGPTQTITVPFNPAQWH